MSKKSGLDRCVSSVGFFFTFSEDSTERVRPSRGHLVWDQDVYMVGYYVGDFGAGGESGSSFDFEGRFLRGRSKHDFPPSVRVAQVPINDEGLPQYQRNNEVVSGAFFFSFPFSFSITFHLHRFPVLFYPSTRSTYPSSSFLSMTACVGFQPVACLESQLPIFSIPYLSFLASLDTVAFKRFIRTPFASIRPASPSSQVELQHSTFEFLPHEFKLGRFREYDSLGIWVHP